MYGSASTWVFNVMRELTIAAYGAAAVHAFFSNDVGPVLADPRAQGRHLVWKLHQPDAAWPDFAVRSRAKIVLTVRDPRDAVVSMMDRFGTGFEAACAAIFNACRAVGENAARPHLGLRYEDRYFDDVRTVGILADHLGLTVDRSEQTRIFKTYTTAQVLDFAQSLDGLPPERIETVGNLTRFDVLTHIHRRHIGDQRIGKWRDRLNSEAHARMSKLFAPVLDAFNYSQ